MICSVEAIICIHVHVMWYALQSSVNKLPFIPTGKVKDVSTQATAVHPSIRSSDVLMLCYLTWDENATDSTHEYNTRKAAELGHKLQTFGNGVYLNEAAADPYNWKTDFWGSNYDRLSEIKKKWDPDNFLTCRYCVGYVENVVSSSVSQTACISVRLFYLIFALWSM